MDMERIYAQYQKYIAITERARLQTLPAREPVLAGSGELLPSPELLAPVEPAPERGKQEIWRPIDAQEVLNRMRLDRN
jgi:hypothetical protein